MEWTKQLRGNQKKKFKNNPTISLRLIDWHECDEREVEEIEYKTKGGELRTRKKITYEYYVVCFLFTCFHRTVFLVLGYRSYP